MLLNTEYGIQILIDTEKEDTAAYIDEIEDIVTKHGLYSEVDWKSLLKNNASDKLGIEKMRSKLSEDLQKVKAL